MIEMNVILRRIARDFPKRIAKANHDYVGLMTGKKPDKVQKILLLLDLDWEILPMVKEYKPDVIITHHPFIFGTRYRVCKYDESKRLLVEEIDKLGIPVYSFHTNFDTGRGGMNDALSKALGLVNVYAPMKNPMMRIGELESPIELSKSHLHLKQYVQLLDNLECYDYQST